jgi:branched-chain amino acid transport system substrate-binding protein
MSPLADGHNRTKNAIELWQEENKEAITINDTICDLEIIIKNSYGDASVAPVLAKELIEENVVAVVGLEYSSLATPAGEVLNGGKTPMIATTATNPAVTLNRPYAFIMGAGNTAMARVLVELGSSSQARTASIIYQDDLAYSSGFAQDLKDYWESLHGTGSVLSFVAFNTSQIDASDYKEQSALIAESNADVLFVPILDSQIPEVVNAVRDAGYENQILGGDAWGVESALQKCGMACVGTLFTAQFVPDMPSAGSFVQTYYKTYELIPDSRDSLAYDAMSLITLALQDYGKWECSIFENRDGLRDALEKVQGFKGVSGELIFDENHSNKCISIARVDSSFSYFFNSTSCLV